MSKSSSLGFRTAEFFVATFVVVGLLGATQIQSKAVSHASASDPVFDVRQFGALGNGMADDTSSIQAAVDAAGRAHGATVRVPAGIYLVNAVAQGGSGILLRDNVALVFDVGAKLKAIPNKAPGYSLITVSHVRNVTIKGGILEGERVEHLGTDGEWGMCVKIDGDSQNVRVLGTSVRQCWGDGFYIFGGTDILIDGVNADGNRRQGLSIISGRNITIRNSIFQNTHGTKPESGIDIEPDAGDTVQNVSIESCKVLNNAGTGIMDTVPVQYISSSHVISVNITGNFIVGNGMGSLRTPPVSGIELSGVSNHNVTNNTLANNTGYGIMSENFAKNNNITGNIFLKNSLGHVRYR